MATIAVYWPVRHFDFVNYDDSYYVYENPRVRGGLTLEGLAWAFSTNYRSNWHPLTWLSHMLDCQLFGLDAGAHHLVNVLFHVASVLLLFHVLNRMTTAPWRSAFVAAVFALHPLRVESVAWVAERKDVLSGFFWMLTVWAYVRYVEQLTVHGSRFRAFYGLALLFFALGLMAKPMLVTLPFVLLLLDYWPLGRTHWTQSAAGNDAKRSLAELLQEKLPFLALAIVSCGVTFWAQHTGGAVESLERLPVGNRVANAVVSYVRYLAKAFWPHGLAVFYPYRPWPLEAVAVTGAVLLGVSAWVIRRARCEPQFVVGWLWYLGTLVPVIGLVQVGSQSMADRYTYIPMIGLLIMVAWGVPRRIADQRVRKWVSAAAAALLGLCAVLCRFQLCYWKNTETLFRHALEVTSANWVAHNNLGAALKLAGKRKEAVREFGEAVRLNPNDGYAQINLGTALLEVGKFPDAIRHLEQAVRIKPDSVIAHNVLGVAFLNAGEIQKATAQFERALELDPDSADPHYNMGLVLRKAGKAQDAIAQFEQAVRLKPDFTKAKQELAQLRAAQSPVDLRN
ncbi:MAG: tetratricopeptide repeat protein [Verrucomicrobiia bacterium]